MSYLITYYLNRTKTTHQIVIIAHSAEKAKEAVLKWLAPFDRIVKVEPISLIDAR